MSFVKWFKKEGWKRYSIRLAAILIFGIIIPFSEYAYPGSLTESPWFVIAGLCIAYFGFSIGTVYMCIQAYKKVK